MHHQGRRNNELVAEGESLFGRVVSSQLRARSHYPGQVHELNDVTLPVVSSHAAAPGANHRNA